MTLTNEQVEQLLDVLDTHLFAKWKGGIPHMSFEQQNEAWRAAARAVAERVLEMQKEAETKK